VPLLVPRKIHADLEVEAERLQTKTLTLMKDDGKTDKYAEAASKCADDVVAAKLKVNEAYLNVQLLKQHLRSWDKNHENAQPWTLPSQGNGKDGQGQRSMFPLGERVIEDRRSRSQRISHVDAQGNVI
jgi:hypothetical protein